MAAGLDWFPPLVLHSESFHAPGHVGDVLEPQVDEVRGHLVRSGARPADTQDRAVSRQLVELLHELAHRDQRGAGQRAQAPLGLLTDIEENGVTAGGPRLPFPGGDCGDAVHIEDGIGGAPYTRPSPPPEE